MRYVFPEIKVKAFRTVAGKRQQKTFSATQNPFNRNANGEPKTAEEIRAELIAQAEAWKAAAE